MFKKFRRLKYFKQFTHGWIYIFVYKRDRNVSQSPINLESLRLILSKYDSGIQNDHFVYKSKVWSMINVFVVQLCTKPEKH